MISFGDTPLLGLEPRDQREERMLRLHDPASARDLLTYRELEAEAAARQAAEARIAGLETRLRNLERTMAESKVRKP